MYLPGHLKVQVLLEMPLSSDIFHIEFSLLVISLDEELNNGTRLPESDATVGINNCRQATIGVDSSEPWLLGVFHNHGLVGNSQFLQNNDDFVRIRSGLWNM